MTEKINILVLGGGGREHALCWKLAQSEKCARLYCTPANGGISELAETIELDITDHQATVTFCQKAQIKLVVIGPEAPLTEGLADSLRAKNIPTFGPGKQAAQLEGSKGFTKDICTRYHIPTAAYKRCTSKDEALTFLKTQPLPIVIKADGLAAGKGVIIAETEQEAHQAVETMFGGKFGEAGTEIVIEAFLQGEEASFFAICDGKTALPLATAQDHKRLNDGDKGPNTGGMGAYSPAPIMTNARCHYVMKHIITPTLQAMAEQGTPYQGILYAGLMVGENGIDLIEYNARFGDPECQVLLPRLKTDLVDLLLWACNGELAGKNIEWHEQAALTIVMAAKGYPNTYQKGSEIKNLETTEGLIFHAGTKKENDKIYANGGRVLTITAMGDTIQQAHEKAYKMAKKIDWEDGFYRKDIGWRALKD